MRENTIERKSNTNKKLEIDIWFSLKDKHNLITSKNIIWLRHEVECFDFRRYNNRRLNWLQRSRCVTTWQYRANIIEMSSSRFFSPSNIILIILFCCSSKKRENWELRLMRIKDEAETYSYAWIRINNNREQKSKLENDEFMRIILTRSHECSLISLFSKLLLVETNFKRFIRAYKKILTRLSCFVLVFYWLQLSLPIV